MRSSQQTIINKTDVQSVISKYEVKHIYSNPNGVSHHVLINTALLVNWCFYILIARKRYFYKAVFLLILFY